MLPTSSPACAMAANSGANSGAAVPRTGNGVPGTGCVAGAWPARSVAHRKPPRRRATDARRRARPPDGRTAGASESQGTPLRAGGGVRVPNRRPGAAPIGLVRGVEMRRCGGGRCRARPGGDSLARDSVSVVGRFEAASSAASAAPGMLCRLPVTTEPSGCVPCRRVPCRCVPSGSVPHIGMFGCIMVRKEIMIPEQTRRPAIRPGVLTLRLEACVRHTTG